MEYSYYGSMDGNTPKKGVICFMFEEAMKKCLDKCLDKMQNESEKIQKQNQKQIEKLIAETKSLNERFGWLLKVFEKDELKEKVKKFKEERVKEKI